MKIRSLTPAESQRASGFIIEAMAGNRRNVQKLQAYLRSHPSYKANRHIMAIDDDGSWLSHVLMEDRLSVRIENARVKTALVSYVGTPPEYRNRGLASATMRAAAEWARKQGYALIILSSAPGAAFHVYRKIGYARFCDEPHVTVSVADVHPLAQEKSPYRVRRFSPNDVPAAARLYRRTYQGVTGTIVRTPAYWRWALSAKADSPGPVNHRDPDIAFTALKNGTPVAYALGTTGTFHIPEGGACILWECAHAHGHISAYRAILGACARLMLKKRLHTLRVAAPTTHPVFLPLRERGGTLSMDVHRHDLALVPDHQVFLNALLPALERRIACSRFGGRNLRLALAAAEKPLVLRSRNGNLAIAKGTCPDTFACSAESMTQMLIGYRSAENLCDCEQATVTTENARETAEVLFPELRPWQSHLDS